MAEDKTRDPVEMWLACCGARPDDSLICRKICELAEQWNSLEGFDVIRRDLLD